MSKKLAELLLKDRVISQAHFTEAEKASDGKDMIKYLIGKKILSESKLLYYLSQRFGLPSINLSKFEIKPDVLKLVPLDLARKTQVIPIQSNRGTLVVALCDPTRVSELEDVKFATKLNVEAVLTSYSVFEQAFQKYYSGGAGLMVQAAATFKQDEARKTAADGPADFAIEIAEVHDIDSADSHKDAPVIAFVNGVLSEGIRRGASDIHVEPYEKRMRVRFRIDGSMIEITEVPMQMKRAVIARLKIMSRMDISESRVPQDGRIKLKVSGKDMDFRVNTMPTLFGEKVVLRLLSQGNLQLDLEKLGFGKAQLEVFKRGIYAPNGMVLVTGPTGSGKTTTLYSALMELNKITDNLSTVEDPVEYNLEGINQVQINKDVGLTFGSVLRALLRQDPDTVLVGEIRDYETAEVAVQAALTGHLVLSTLHTNDAPSTVTRLMNMGVEPFLVTASVNTIVAQRLLRRICSQCKTEKRIPREKLIEFGLDPAIADKVRPMAGRGCGNCADTGYKGRVAIYEVMDFSNSLKEMVLTGASAMELKKQAAKEGMQTLRMSAINKASDGTTTFEEALSLTMEG